MDAPRGEEVLSSTPTGPLTSKTQPVDVDVVQAVLSLEHSPFAYWNAPEGLTLVGIGRVAGIPPDVSPVTIQDQLWDRITFSGPSVARPRILGARAFDQTVQDTTIWRGFSSSYFFLPRHLITRKDNQVWHTVTAPPEEIDDAFGELEDMGSCSMGDEFSIVEKTPRPERASWLSRVEALRKRIASGQVQKVVMAHSQQIRFDQPPTPAGCITQLESANKNCYICLIRPSPEAFFVAATPERLLSRRSNTIRTGALAGSVERGSTEEQDDRLSASLQADSKECHEHQLVVDAITSELEHIGANVTLEKRQIRRLRTVQHLYTPITATIDQAPHVLDLAEAIHPTPAVGGIPRPAALAAIREFEDFARGWYAGPIGWFDSAKDGTLAIGIRSALIRGNSGHLFAGAGIVEESDPTSEWEEVQWKYRPILDAFSSS